MSDMNAVLGRIRTEKVATEFHAAPDVVEELSRRIPPAPSTTPLGVIGMSFTMPSILLFLDREVPPGHCRVDYSDGTSEMLDLRAKEPDDV